MNTNNNTILMSQIAKDFYVSDMIVEYALFNDSMIVESDLVPYDDCDSHVDILSNDDLPF